MLVIGFIGGAGTGKSTQAASIFVELKKLQYNVELITEYAKDMTWQESLKVLDNQIYVFGKQHNRIWRVKDKVDIAVTDSPLLLSCIYLQHKNQAFVDLIIQEWKKYDNLLFYIKRNTKYTAKGRNQTLTESIAIDEKILTLLHQHNINYETISDLKNAHQQIFDTTIKRLRQ